MAVVIEFLEGTARKTNVSQQRSSPMIQMEWHDRRMGGSQRSEGKRLDGAGELVQSWRKGNCQGAEPALARARMTAPRETASTDCPDSNSPPLLSHYYWPILPILSSLPQAFANHLANERKYTAIQSQ